MVTLLYHRSFAVIPLLRGDSEALNQSHIRNFSAYIITDVTWLVIESKILKLISFAKLYQELDPAFYHNFKHRSSDEGLTFETSAPPFYLTVV